MERNLQEFLKFLSAYKALYKSLDVRVIAYRMPDYWVNVATRITLQSTPVRLSKIMMKLPQLANLKVIHQIRPAADIETILGEMSQAKIRLNDIEVLFGQHHGNEFKPQLFFHRNIFSRDRPGYFGGINYKTLILHGSGSSIHEIIRDQEDLDWQLRAWNPPYDGLADLATNFLQSERTLDSSYSTYAEIRASTFLRFGRHCRFEGDELILEVEHPQGIDFDNLNLGMVLYPTRGRIKRLPYGKRSYRIKRGKTKSIFRKKIRGYRGAQVFLKYNEDVTESTAIFRSKSLDLNPSLVALSHFDPEYSLLRGALSGQGKRKGVDFEGGIAILVGLAGFLCHPYGVTSKLGDAPDGIAFVPGQSRGIIFECTTGLPDTKGKLSKLSLRFKELQMAYPTLDLRPVIFTSLKSTVLPKTELEIAATEGIAMVGSEQINEILEGIKKGCREKEILDYLSQLVPVRNELSSPFGVGGSRLF